MSNMLDDENEPFNDQNDELNEPGAVPVAVDVAPTYAPPVVRRSSKQPYVQEPVREEDINDVIQEDQEDQEEENENLFLVDARIRLEQGRLYEMVLKHDMFDNVDADTKAIKIVQKEIRRFAQERMEIMLGMRQEQSKEQSFPMESFPFNSLEIEALKALASAATKGASRDAEPFSPIAQPAPKKQTLNTIGANTFKTTKVPERKAAPAPQKPLNKPVAPVKRAAVSEKVQRILEEEGVTLDQIDAVFNPSHKPLTPDEFNNMTVEELAERNKKVRTYKQVQNPQAAPMPTTEHMEAIYTSRASSSMSNPLHAKIMDQLLKK